MPRSLQKIALWFFIVICFAGCDQLDVSPRKKVVKDAIQSVCSQKSIGAIDPYVTEASRPIVQLAATFSQLGDATGLVRVTDSIAIACADTKVKVLDEVKVSDSRYIVRVKTGEENSVENFAVVQENGSWKIALIDG